MRTRASAAWRRAHLLLLPAGVDTHDVVDLARRNMRWDPRSV